MRSADINRVRSRLRSAAQRKRSTDDGYAP
jgi:hypothetical protein